MAKVTLLTSREIFKHFKLTNDQGEVEKGVIKLERSDEYKSVFCHNEDGTGIIGQILKSPDKETVKQYHDGKDDIDKVAQCIKPHGPNCNLGDFKAEVYKIGHYYFAWEYPYKNDKTEAKYKYLDAIIGMIFVEEERIETFYMYSHDRDFNYSRDGLELNNLNVDNSEIPNLRKLFDDYVSNGKGKVMLFQHNSTCFSKILEEIKEGIKLFERSK